MGDSHSNERVCRNCDNWSRNSFIAEDFVDPEIIFERDWGWCDEIDVEFVPEGNGGLPITPEFAKRLDPINAEVLATREFQLDDLSKAFIGVDETAEARTESSMPSGRLITGPNFGCTLFKLRRSHEELLASKAATIAEMREIANEKDL